MKPSAFRQLDSDDAIDVLARRLLARATLFAPGEPIPRDLLVATLESEDSDSNRMASAEALGRLLALGLLESDEKGRITLHQSAATFARERGLEGEDREAVEGVLQQTASQLNRAGSTGSLLAWQIHLRFVADMAFHRDDEVAGLLCSELGYHLMMIGDHSGASRYWQRALEISEKRLGPDHLQTSMILSKLGSVLQDLGDLPGARERYQRALEISEKRLGPDHPNTAGSLNNLAFVLQNLGDLAAARELHERALGVLKRVLGPEHPFTATSLNNLGSVLQDLGDFSGAREQHVQALEIREKVLGPEHPETAMSLHNLGGALQALGDLSGARERYERALAIREKVLGPEHRKTRFTRSNLASLDDPALGR